MVSRISQLLGLWSLRDLSFEGRVLIIKAIVLPMLLYVAVVFPPPRTVLLCLIRRFMYFFWRSKCEKLRREVLYLEHGQGGKGFPDLRLKLGVHFVAKHLGLVFFHSNKAACFVRYYLGGVLRGLKMFSPSLNVPTAFHVPYYYSVLRNTLVRYDLCGIRKETWTKPKVVCFLVTDRTDPCTIGPLSSTEVRDVWTTVSHPRLLNQHKDLNWQAVHEILPVRRTMYRRSLARSPTCPRTGCGLEESAAHLLWDCQAAQAVWLASREFLDLHVAWREVDSSLVLYGQTKRPMPRKQWLVFWYVVSAVKEALWKARNLFVLQEKLLPSPAVWRMAVSIAMNYFRRSVKQDGLRVARRQWRVAWTCP